MKKLTVIALMVFLLSCQLEAAQKYFLVKSDTSILSAPKSAASKVTSIARGQRLKAIKVGKAWVKVTVYHYTGWVNKENLILDTRKATTIPQSILGCYTDIKKNRFLDISGEEINYSSMHQGPVWHCKTKKVLFGYNNVTIYCINKEPQTFIELLINDKQLDLNGVLLNKAKCLQ